MSPTTFTSAPEGLVHFVVTVRIDMDELRTWRPEMIAALFTGIAQVLEASKEKEKP